MTFVNIAVAISALAGGRGPFKISHRVQILLVFSYFFDDFLMSELQNAWKRNFGSFWQNFNGILGHFGRLPAMEKRAKVKKHCQ